MRTINGTATPSAWPPHVPPPTLNERRGMKKAAQPEHSYTGHIPKWLQETEDPGVQAQQNAQQHNQHKRSTPILGYSGHLRHEEDRVGTTFSRGLEIARQPVAAPAGPLTKPADYSRQERLGPNGNNNEAYKQETKKKVTFDVRAPNEKVSQGRPTQLPTAKRASGFGAFDTRGASGDFQAKPMSTRSGYGAFDGASGYGEIATKPMSARSGYGAFDGASGYGEFAAKPMSVRSGYGAFDGASGYGEFAARPMSARSGYGAFDGASGYGEFATRPMSARSGYGEFDAASGYGDFQERPEVEEGDEQSSPRSGDSRGYGAFDGGGGNGSVEYGDFVAPGSGYGAFDNASGYGQFLAAPSAPENRAMTHESQRSVPQPASRPIIIKQNDDLDRKYQRALRAVGGEANVHRLLDAFAATIAQRHHKRTELLQSIKRNFEKHEQQSQGKMTKSHVKEALQGLSCVFTDDQIMALMAVYDPECRGYVSMDTLLTDLTRRVIA